MDVYEKRKLILGLPNEPISQSSSSTSGNVSVNRASERYKAYMDRLKEKGLDKVQGYFGFGTNPRFRVVKDHYIASRNLEGRTDTENRIRILNGDRKYIENECQSRDNRQEDPVFQRLAEASIDYKAVFRELKELTRAKYKDNSRKNPKAKKHMQFFRDYISRQIERIRKRAMDEETYTNLLGAGGLVYAFEESKKEMEELAAYHKSELSEKEAQRFIARRVFGIRVW